MTAQLFSAAKGICPSDRLTKAKLPQHVAVIMDGNGRWAKQRGLPRVEGHRQGAKALKEMLRYCKTLGIKTLTAYAFSTENWSRPQGEVNFLLGLFEKLLQKELQSMKAQQVRLNFIGDLSPLPPSLQQIMHYSMERTKDNQGILFNVAINYGGRHELVQACRTIAAQVQQKKLDFDSISEDTISRHLYTSASTDPDLLIRTSGEMRLSNFLLWQLAYTEIYVADTLWPDFGQGQFEQALVSYQQRDRRFGKID